MEDQILIEIALKSTSFIQADKRPSHTIHRITFYSNVIINPSACTNCPNDIIMINIPCLYEAPPNRICYIKNKILWQSILRSPKRCLSRIISLFIRAGQFVCRFAAPPWSILRTILNNFAEGTIVLSWISSLRIFEDRFFPQNIQDLIWFVH